MRVFCPEHKRGFLTPRQNPIKCENKGHILGELDFAGETKGPVALQWQYCCNCEHFCPIDFDQNSLERCPVCTRRSSTAYLCERCLTISFESNTPVQTKNFTLTLEGLPQPSCPGCLRAPSADLHEHTCDALGVFFVTAFNSCPICRERLDIGPSFPSSVAYYLRRTKSANKFNVTFDYETELFVPVEDGEFVLISNGNEATQSIVLPRSEHFATKRDFYDFYQDYYHCASPDAGEVNIIQPAAVIATVAGWKLQAPGMLEVLRDQPEKKVATDAKRHQVATPARESAGFRTEATKENSAVTPCAHCGTFVETRYAFCWKCANPMTPTNEPSVTHSKVTMPSTETVTVDEEQTVQHDVPTVRSPIFSSALAKERERVSQRNSAVLKLITIIVVGLVIVALGLFVLTRSDSRMGSVAAAPPANPDMQSIPVQVPGGEVKNSLAKENTPQQNSIGRPEDVEFKRLREKRIAATASDRLAIVQAFVKAENQYPNDYRFPYERAKLTIGPQSHSHDEAFDLLTLAAEKAVNSGKAHEMLDSLEVDKGGDFHKLSHGHREWTQLMETLKDKDTKPLARR